MRKWMSLLTVVLVVMSGVAELVHASGVVIFALSSLAIVPLAGWMGRSTESIAAHAGARIGGLLSATFGNAVELIIGIMALREGLTTIVKASITGSILGNLLFVLGISFFVGGIRHPIQRFNIRAARSNASMLLMAIGVTFIVPAMFTTSQSHTSMALSTVTSVVAFALYISGLYFSLFTHREVFESINNVTEDNQESGQSGQHWKLRTSVFVLLIATVLVGVESEWLVTSMKHLTARLGWSEVFVGVVVVAVIGNAAEHASAVWMAWKNRMDLSMEIAVGSTLQVAMFVAPLLFWTSLVLGNPMPLIFSWPELATMAAAVLLVVVLLMDGESNWLEGAMAVGAYVVIAVGFFTLTAS